MKIELEIDGFKYESDSISKPIPGVFIQMDGGDNNPIIRKDEIYNNLDQMWATQEKKGYYPCNDVKAITSLIPVTYTNNPHLLD